MTRIPTTDRTTARTLLGWFHTRTAGALALVPALAFATLLAAACGSGTQDKPLTQEQKDAIARAAGQTTLGKSPSSAESQAALFDRLAGTGTAQQGSRATDLVRRATVPVITSPYSQRRTDRESPLLTDFPTPSRPPYPERQLFDDVDWLAALPPPSEEVPGVRIGWYLNGSIAAFRSAIDRNIPLVLVIGESACADCARLAKALRCAAVERLAGDAVFAYGFPSREKGTFALAGSLEIDSYPTITILEPESRMLFERVRISGFYDATAVGNHLEEALWRVAPRGYHEVEPNAERSPSQTPRAARPSTAAEAEAAAKQRGLVHGPPAPVCK